ncbi:uncharacterized protein [Sinocyclocheilus grahami]|uniref:uncharacterized protein n=1 Tax=Sinocyclocheilus grahami TaxID=75366 RepID=UPI0007AD4F32|nr:PREDICTED: uncharacterized protein LOC107583621 [Sinocyclocheilus grahami]
MTVLCLAFVAMVCSQVSDCFRPLEREVVQKRTFTRWMNLHLEKCNPRMEVRDLFCDIQDGKILMALLEELSGCKLLHGFKPSSHRIFRLNNIAKVLTFLEERNVKLVSIDAADIADGNPSIVLGLIWNIILFFQIKELTGNIKSQFPSSSSLSSIPTSSDSDTSHSSTPSDDRKPTIAPRGHGRVIKTLLQWVQRRTRKYGVAVQDFGKSWTSGLAFLAVIKSIDNSLVDMRRALLRTPRENIEEAFRTAHYSLGIPRLLEPEEPSSDDSSCLESDSGYFQDNKEAMTAQPENESLLTSTVDEEVSGVLESEAFQDNVEYSNTEAMQRDTLDLRDGPEEKPFIFEDHSEPECPVLQYKRVSISGSEEDIKLCADHAEEPTEEPGKNLPNGHSETNENSDLRDREQEAVLESEVKDVVFEEPEEPISDWSQTEVEIPDEDQVCYMCGGPVAKSSAESSEQGDDCLSHLNSTEKDCNSDLRHFSESEGNFEDNPREKNNELNGTVCDLKNEPRESKGIHEDLLIIGKSPLENGSDGIRRTEFSHNTNSESQAQVSDNMEPRGVKDNRPVSVVDSHYDVLNSVTETFVEPLSDTSIHDGENDSTLSQSLHRLHPEVSSTELPIEEETTFEDSKFVIGVRGYPERRPAELRLSLSMTPLQPAPPKRSLTESDTDTEDTSEDHGKGFKSRKDRAGSMHIQEQSPFDRHPGEWGAVEPDSPAEHCELIKTDDNLTISAGARENTGAMREGAVTDASQPLTTIHLRKVIDITESKGQNGKALDRSKVDSTIINKR